jgi:transcription termination/antitermination protein NusG
MIREIEAATGSAVLRWYAAYTTPRHEKKVAAHLDARGVEHFLPLFSTAKRWRDGSRVTVKEPLFPNYVFVRMALRQRAQVLALPGVLWMVGARAPEALPDNEIEILRAALPGRRCEPHPFLAVGNKVRVRRGPLRGALGVVARVKNELRLVITIDLLMRSVAVEVDAGDLEIGTAGIEKEDRIPGTVRIPHSGNAVQASWAEAGR